MRWVALFTSAAAIVCGVALWAVVSTQPETMNDAFDAGIQAGEVHGIRMLECQRHDVRDDGQDWCELQKLPERYINCVHEHMPRVAVCEGLIR